MEDEEVGSGPLGDNDDYELFDDENSDEGEAGTLPAADPPADDVPPQVDFQAAASPPQREAVPPVILDQNNLFTEAELENLVYLQETNPLAAMSVMVQRQSRFETSCRRQFEDRIATMAATNPMIAAVRDDIRRLADGVEVHQLQYPASAENIARLAVGNAVMEGRFATPAKAPVAPPAPAAGRAAQPAAERTPAAQGASRGAAPAAMPRSGGLASYLKQSLGLTDSEVAAVRGHKRGAKV